MTSSSPASARGSLLVLALALLAPAGGAQVIPIKTVPVAQADQFAIFPSDNAAMGGVSIALDDPSLDPFVNPAKGRRLRRTQAFGSPVFYSVSERSGAGRTLPVGAFVRSGPTFGGMALALQEIDPADRGFIPGDLPIVGFLEEDASLLPGEPPRNENAFAYGMLGRTFAERRLSVGVSALWADLRAIDGVDLLYAGSRRLDQFGNMLDLRLGMTKELRGGRTVEAVLLHNRWGMTHDVTYVDQFWDPTLRQFQLRPRLEHNLDRTNTWGMHLEYERPLPAPGWRAGGVLTVNLLSHPKIPNYEIMNIPRDPGRSRAYNLGIGLSKTVGPDRFGMDVVLEPIWSHTWADAETAMEAISGAVIPQGGRTIENHFRFTNALFRMGVSRELPIGTGGEAFGIQLGIATRSIRYRLTQHDHVQATTRKLRAHWTEWTPSWGASLRFSDLVLRYTGRLTSGTGRPGVDRGGGPMVLDAAASRSSILIAPSGPVVLDDVSVKSHQFSISLPIR